MMVSKKLPKKHKQSVAACVPRDKLTSPFRLNLHFEVVIHTFISSYIASRYFNIAARVPMVVPEHSMGLMKDVSLHCSTIFLTNQWPVVWLGCSWNT